VSIGPKKHTDPSTVAAHDEPGGAGPVDIDQWFADVLAVSYENTSTAHFVITAEYSDPPTTMSYEGDMDLTDPDRPMMAFTVSAEGVDPFDMVLVDGKGYMKQGDSYRRIPGKGITEIANELYPHVTIERDRRAVLKIELVGTEEVEGAQTTHYVLTYDATRLSHHDVTGDTFELELWLDEKMRTIKTSTASEMNVEGKPLSMALETIYSDHGKPVTIETPPKHRLTDLLRRIFLRTPKPSKQV